MGEQSERDSGVTGLLTLPIKLSRGSKTLVSTSPVSTFPARQTADLLVSRYIPAGEFWASSPRWLKATEATKQHMINAFKVFFFNWWSKYPVYMLHGSNSFCISRHKMLQFGAKQNRQTLIPCPLAECPPAACRQSPKSIYRSESGPFSLREV